MATTYQRMPLGEVVRFGNGKSIKPGGEGRYPVYGSNGIIGGSDEYRHENGIIIGRVGAYCGSVAYCPDRFWASDNTLVAFPASDAFDTKFLFYLLTDARLSRHAGGAAQPLVTQTVLKQVEVSVPPLPVQRRIAGILSSYDDLIENNQRRIKILEEMARSLYREWFVHFRFPGHDKVKMVPSSLGPIPQGWEVKRLGEIAEDMRRNVPKGQLDRPQPYVGLERIPRRSLALDAWKMTTDLGSNKLEFKKGEVLFGKIRPYFHKVSVAPFDGLCSADTIVIRGRRSNHYAFVVACVSSDAFVAEASATANGAKMPRANWDVLEKYPVVVPNGKVAEKFSALMADIIAQQQALIFQVQNLRRSRDLLLPRLLSGQLDLKSEDAIA
jgi:type I restriction enzyme S subunit